MTATEIVVASSGLVCTAMIALCAQAWIVRAVTALFAKARGRT